MKRYELEQELSVSGEYVSHQTSNYYKHRMQLIEKDLMYIRARETTLRKRYRTVILGLIVSVIVCVISLYFNTEL